MRTPFVAAYMSLALIVVAVGAAASPSAEAADAGAAIETVQSLCTSGSFIPPPRISIWKLDCVAIFRNRSDRPVYDIEIDMHVGGLFHGEASGTRTALRAGESALLRMYWAIEDDIARDAPVTFVYRAAWTGDAGDLDVPKPELQYVDRVERDCCVAYIGEVRNVDGRRWSTVTEDEIIDRSPDIAFFSRGKLVGARATAWREPDARIGPNGRYVFWADEVDRNLSIDAVEVFFRDEFVPAGSRFKDANWQLTGLDHAVQTDASGHRRMTFRASVHNPTLMRTIGPLFVVARRADFHAIGLGRCDVEVAPGADGACEHRIDLIEQRDASFDDVRFVTVELGGAVAFLPTPTPVPSATPCPVRRTPAPVPTLAAVAGRVWLPWSLQMMPEWCP